MATYEELYDLSQDSILLNRMTAAIVVECDVIRADGTATDPKKAWARNAFASPRSAAQTALWAALAANKDQTVATIQAATDAALQTALHNAVSLLAGE